MQLVSHSVQARNRFYDRSGFTPSQRVFGSLPRYPHDMLSDDQLDAEVLALGVKKGFHRAHELWTAALEAFFKHSAHSKIACAMKGTTKPPPFKTGDLVFVMRRNSFGKTWREGPGTILMLQGSKAWVSVHGEL